MWKKVVCLFLILSFIIMMVGCGGVPTAPPISSELVLVRVTDPKSNLISVAGKENEDAMAILGEKDIEGNPTSITGAVYVFEQEDSFGIDAGIDGLPTYLIDSEGNKVIFDNYTNSTVDISLYNSNGDLIQEPIIINVDPADLLELKQLYNSFYSQQKSWGKNVADDIATGLRWGAKAIPWVACAITGGALYFAPFTVLYPPIGFAAYACISTVIFTTIEAISPPSFSFIEYEQEGVTAEGCSSSGLLNPLACVSTIYNVLAYGIEQGFGTNHAPIISSLIANPSSININGATTITCTASDENIGDTLTYTWTKTDGTFEGSTTVATVTWRAPSTSDTYTVTCEVSDGEGSDSKSVAVTVNDPGSINYSPDITSTAITSATKGQPYSYNVDAIDSDGDTLTYSLTTKPSGMTINSSTGLITWTPTTSGNYNVTVKVSDGELSDTQSFTVTVEENGTTLGQVQLLSPSNGATLPPGNISFSWNSVSNATKYQFILYNQQGGIALDSTYSSTSTTVALGTEETITWKVRAGDNSGNWGAWSSTWSLTLKSTTIPLPNPPTPLSPGTTSDPGPTIDTLTPTLQWQTVSNADYYNLSISVYPYGTSNIIYNPQQIYGSSITVPSGTLEAGKKYRWNMRAHNSAGFSDYSSTLYFQTGSTIGNVILILYICENSTSGSPLSGVSVGISDGGGNSFSQTTNSSGYVTITGIPGTWSFTAMKSGYDTNSWSQSITTNCTKYGYIVKSATPVGTIDVFAILDGSAWIGSLSYSLTGPSSLSGSTVPAVLSNKPVGSYSIAFNSGGPSNASLSSITPSSAQTLSAGGITVFTFNFITQAPPLGQVQLSSPGNGSTLPPMNVTFIWNSVSNATKYQFILYNQQGGIALDSTYSSTFVIVALGTEETITWKVRAGDNSGNWGAWSSTWSLTIKK